MEYEPAEYQKLEIKQFPSRNITETTEGKFWKRFKAPVQAKQFGPVTSIDFCSEYPHNFAVTSSTRVIVYDGLSRQAKRTFSRFKDTAYSGSFRRDGKLLVAGGANGLVQVFDASSRMVLRQLKGHQGPVHVAKFSPDKVHILSGGDDVTVRLWDVSVGSQVVRMDGHSDYVRAAAVNPVSIDTWASGGYDHTVCCWDSRSGECTMKLDHGAPIEDLAFFPAGTLLVTVGGTQMCIWDTLSGGRLLKRLTNFQKTVTSVLLSPLAGPDTLAAPRLLAGSLDGHVKIFELDTFKVVAASKYPAPVLCLGLDPACATLAVGMADGTLAVRRHQTKAAQAVTSSAAGQRKAARSRPRLTAGNFRYFIRGQNEKAAETEYRVARRRKAKLKSYDKLLRQFRYREVLDAAMSTRNATVVVSVLDELAVRGALVGALGGRSAESLLPLLKFLAKYINDPQYSQVCCNVAHRVLDTYAGVVGLSAEVDRALLVLQQVVAEELALHRTLMALQGGLEMLLASAARATAAATDAATDAALPLTADASASLL